MDRVGCCGVRGAGADAFVSRARERRGIEFALGPPAGASRTRPPCKPSPPPRPALFLAPLPIGVRSAPDPACPVLTPRPISTCTYAAPQVIGFTAALGRTTTT
jgi:hypothetical protein